MKGLLLIGGAILAFIVILTLLIIRIELDYRRKGEDDVLSVTVSTMGGLIRFKRQFPVLILDTDEQSIHVEETRSGPFTSKKTKRQQRITVDKIKHKQQQWQQLKTHINGLYRIIKAFLSKVRCQQLVWHSTIGTGDAAETGVMTGLIWSLKSVTLGFSTGYLRMETVPDFRVTPDFNQPRLETHITCILKFRLGQAMLTGLRLFFRAKKYGLIKRLTQAEQTANEAC